jgi:hypothetical protein
MARIRRGLSIVTAICVCGLALAGCGSSAHSQHSANTAAGNPSTTTQQGQPQTAAQLAQERAIGNRALLRLSDLPAGWTAGEREGKSKEGPELRKEVAACLRVTVAQLDENDPAEVESPKFKESEDSIGNSIIVRPTQEAAVSYFSVFNAPNTASCLTSSVRKVFSKALSRAEHGRKLPAGVEVGSPTVERMSFPPVGEQSVAYRIGIPFSAAGINLTYTLDAVVVRVGRADASLTFTSTTSSPIATSIEQQLTSLTVRRLNQALHTVAPA